MNRRTFLKKTLATAMVVAGVFSSVPGFPQGFWDQPRTLWLKRSTTGEQARFTYWANGQYVHEGYKTACYLLRDVQVNAVIGIDPVLLDILRGIQGWLELHNIYRPIVINSGHRTDKTNSATEGAARNSLHKEGKAADIRIEGIPIEYLGELARYLQGGGVGIYIRKNFLHVDCGRIRSWRGA